MSEAHGAPEDEDREARERALDPTRSILLQAPAGSGKTTVLTERYLRLLPEVDEPEEILAITFTRKAAAEMRERVVQALLGRPGETAAHEQRRRELAARARAHGAARGWLLEQYPGRLRIQTIDSLNHWIASQLPIAARAGGRLRLCERPRQLYRLAARRTLTDAESVEHLQPQIELLFERLDNDYGRLEALLAEMLEKRAHWLRRLLRGTELELHERVARSLREIVADRIRRLTALLPAPLIAEGAEIARAAARHRRAAGDAGEGAWTAWLVDDAPLGADSAQLPRWQALAALALGSSGEWRRALSAREGFPQEDKRLKARCKSWIEALARIEGARAALAALAPLPEARLSADDAASLEALAGILTFACQELEVVFQEHGEVDHAHVAAAARQALTEDGAPTDLGLRLGARVRHLLVDEFQDTSIEQFELLEALTAGWEQGDGNSLFAVGDPMQSIYLFREAEVGLFLRARDRGIGALRFESLRLTRNFRALPALVQWTNARLERVFPPADEVRTSAVRFLPSVPALTADRPERIGLHCTREGDAWGEALAIAALAEELRAASPDASIAVLVSSRAHAAPISAALESAAVPTAGIDLVPLADVPVVRDLAELTRALDHLGDRSAWLAVLRAPWCGLTLEDLHALVAGERESTVWELVHAPERLAHLEAAARARLERTREVLGAALAARDRAPLADWVEATWLRLGGPAACAREEDLEHAAAFFAALGRRAQAIDWHGPAELDELLGELYANTPAAPRGAVQIMTIHAAKGLEFDHVVLPGLGRRLRPDREPLMRWLELPRLPDGSDLLIAPLPPIERRERHPISELIRSLQRERLRNERARLLYVALTRARRGLHLFGHLRAPRAAEAQGRPESGTLLELLWPAIGADFPQSPESPPAGAVPMPRGPLRFERLTGEWHVPPLDPPLASRSLRVASYETDDESPAGHVVVETRGRRARRAPADERGQWLLCPTHRALATDLELTGLHQGELVSVHIDRTFIDEQGTRWVIELSDAAPRSAQPAAELIEAETLRRSARLARSAALARLLGPEPVRAGWYFVALGVFRELSEGS